MRTLTRLCLPIVAAVALLAGTVGPAGANSGSGVIGQSHNGGCAAQYWWDSNGWFSQNPYVPAVQTSCTSHLQFKVACGVYGVPSTYYWYSMRYEIFSHAYPYNWFTTPVTNTCPYWGNDIVLDVALMEHSDTGGWNACYRLNRGYWVYTDGSLPCYPVGDFAIQWGVG